MCFPAPVDSGPSLPLPLSLSLSPSLSPPHPPPASAGVIGGLTFTPKRLRAELEEVKAALDDPDAFMCGVDLAIPQLGNGARKTNHDC